MPLLNLRTAGRADPPVTRRTVQIDKDGETFDMDWDSPKPPTQTDVMNWMSQRKTPEPLPTPTRANPLQVNVGRGLSQGAKGLDPTIPKIESPHVTNPLEILGATSSATGRGFGSLIDKPGNLKDAMFEAGKGLVNAPLGQSTSPVTEADKRTGVKTPPAAAFILDSIADVGNVADPMKLLIPGAVAGLSLRGSGKAMKQGAKTAAETANQARIASMLSGWALPKSVLGNVGSPFVATAENLTAGKGAKSFAPIKEALNVKENVKQFGKGWKSGANPTYAGASGVGKYNPITRTMNAADYATQEGLKRAGLTEEEAQRLLLRDPQWGLKGEGSWLQDYLIPFKRTPFNVLQGGMKTMQDHPLLSAGALTAGAGVGSTTDDPRALALSTALMGPYSLPYMIGAGLTAGTRAAGGLSPIPDWSLQKSIGDPLNPFTAPAFTRMFDTPGKKTGASFPRLKSSGPKLPSLRRP